jgi:hypothetical protein
MDCAYLAEGSLRNARRLGAIRDRAAWAGRPRGNRRRIAPRVPAVPRRDARSGRRVRDSGEFTRAVEHGRAIARASSRTDLSQNGGTCRSPNPRRLTPAFHGVRAASRATQTRRAGKNSRAHRVPSGFPTADACSNVDIIGDSAERGGRLDERVDAQSVEPPGDATDEGNHPHNEREITLAPGAIDTTRPSPFGRNLGRRDRSPTVAEPPG